MGVHQITRAIFLDRDGVINRVYECLGTTCPPKNLEELQILPGVPEALAQLRLHGFRLIVATNQPDVRRGTQPIEVVQTLHNYLRETLPLDDIFACYHDTQDNCPCRKPKPGMLLAAALKYQIQLSSSYMVGDRWSDVAAGNQAGCKTIWIGSDETKLRATKPDFIAASLNEAVPWILQQMQIPS